MLDLAGGSGYPAIPLAKELPDARITLTGVLSTALVAKLAGALSLNA